MMNLLLDFASLLVYVVANTTQGGKGDDNEGTEIMHG